MYIIFIVCVYYKFNFMSSYINIYITIIIIIIIIIIIGIYIHIVTTSSTSEICHHLAFKTVVLELLSVKKIQKRPFCRRGEDTLRVNSAIG